MPCVMMMGQRSRAEVWANDVGSLVVYCAELVVERQHALRKGVCVYEHAVKVSFSMIAVLLLSRSGYEVAAKVLGDN